MPIIRGLSKKILIISKKLRNDFRINTHPRSYQISNLTYYSQWESPKLVEDIINKKFHPKNDPLWKRSGAVSQTEYCMWSWSGCGMACLKMILKHATGKEYKLVTLGKKCLEYGGYKDNSKKHSAKKIMERNNGRPPSDYFDGLFYGPFLEFINKEFHLSGNVVFLMTLKDIITGLSDKKYVIVSVSGSLRNPEREKLHKKGGHLVLVSGYDLDNKLLYLHNPSGAYQKSQEYFPIKFKTFNKYFANRGVVINI